MVLKIYLFILVININVFASPIKALMEEAISAMEQDSFALETFENKIEALCMAQNKQACNILMYIKFAHDTILFPKELSLQLQLDTANAFSVLFAEYLQFIAKNPIKNITPIEVPSIKSCVEKTINCRNAGYLHQKLYTKDDAYTLFLWSKGCQNHDFESCKMITDFYASVNYFSPDSALKYAEKSCKIKANNKCEEKERVYMQIEHICKIDIYAGLELPVNELHLNCIQNVCKNIKLKKYSGKCKVSDFIVFKPYLKIGYLFDTLFATNVLRCFNEEWNYCSWAASHMYEMTYAHLGISFHILFLLYMGCSHGNLESCLGICELQENPYMLPFDKSILNKMKIIPLCKE